MNYEYLVYRNNKILWSNKLGLLRKWLCHVEPSRAETSDYFLAFGLGCPGYARHDTALSYFRKKSIDHL